jgi:hypothetical protein
VVTIDENLLRMTCSPPHSLPHLGFVVPAPKPSVAFIVAFMEWTHYTSDSTIPKPDAGGSSRKLEEAAKNALCASPVAAEDVAIGAVHVASVLKLREDLMEFMFGEIRRWHATHATTPICVTPAKWMDLTTSVISITARTGRQTRLLFAEMLDLWTVNIATANKWVP